MKKRVKHIPFTVEELLLAFQDCGFSSATAEAFAQLVHGWCNCRLDNLIYALEEIKKGNIRG